MSKEELGVSADADRALSATPTEPVPVSSADAVTIADARHTPLPWDNGDDGTITGPHDGEGWPIVAEVIQDHWQQDAAFIVRACNSFYDLYNAAEVAHAALLSINPVDRVVEEQQALDWLSAALAKARGAA